jgi:hypothetical protein
MLLQYPRNMIRDVNRICIDTSDTIRTSIKDWVSLKILGATGLQLSI